jgi:hypothetical protein
MEAYVKTVLPPLVHAFTNSKEPKVKTSDVSKLLKLADKQARTFEKECEKIEKASEGTFKEKKLKPKALAKASSSKTQDCALTKDCQQLIKLLIQVHNAKALKKPMQRIFVFI